MNAIVISFDRNAGKMKCTSSEPSNLYSAVMDYLQIDSNVKATAERVKADMDAMPIQDLTDTIKSVLTRP